MQTLPHGVDNFITKFATQTARSVISLMYLCTHMRMWGGGGMVERTLTRLYNISPSIINKK